MYIKSTGCGVLIIRNLQCGTDYLLQNTLSFAKYKKSYICAIRVKGWKTFVNLAENKYGKLFFIYYEVRYEQSQTNWRNYYSLNEIFKIDSKIIW